MKLNIPIPICITCEVCLDVYSLQYHKGHEIRHSDCLHPFLKGITDKLSPKIWCVCDCDDCKRWHRI